MKSVVTSFVGVAFLSLYCEAAELVVASKDAASYLNFSLHRLDKRELKGRSPDNNIEEQMDGQLIWKNIDPGSYRIVIDPDEENFSAHWIGVQTVEVKDGITKVDLELFDGVVEFTLSFDGVAVPKQHMHEKHLILRAERLLENGSVDPLYRDWLWCELEGKSIKGELYYLTPGKYKFTAFSINDKFALRDEAAGVVSLTKADLESKVAKIVMTKLAEKDAVVTPAPQIDPKLENVNPFDE